MSTPIQVLFVEDNAADADLVRDLLARAHPERYQIVQVTYLADAVQQLRHEQVDIILLDLRLLDGLGAQNVECIRVVAGEVPIVVFTGTDDEDIARSCLNAGGQDYLYKEELQARGLRRAIGYAITRREAQMTELHETLARFRALSSMTSGTSVTATLAGTGAVRERHPAHFQDLVRDYLALLDVYIEPMRVKWDTTREMMERVLTRLGDMDAGPRDLLDVHVQALDQAVQGHSDERARTLVLGVRLLALEMMGLLVDYYRVGLRRRFVEGKVR